MMGPLGDSRELGKRGVESSRGVSLNPIDSLCVFFSRQTSFLILLDSNQRNKSSEYDL
jgi:hypothetical protein